MRRLLLVYFVVGLSLVAQAQSGGGSKPLTQDDEKALIETQKMLRDRNKIDAYAKEHPEAKATDDSVRNLMGDQTDATYGLAAEIFGDMVRQANGDPEKLKALIEQAQKNPEAFARKLSPQQQNAIRGLATKIESKGVNQAPGQH